MKRRVIAAVDDLFFAAKIKGTAAQLGVEVAFARDPEKLLEAARAEGTAAVILDLQNSSLDPFEAARLLKAGEETRRLPLYGFYAHVNTDLQRRAHEAAIDHVLPRSVFNRRLLEILGEQSAEY